VRFTTAALKADPVARELASLTESWLPMIEAVRIKERGTRQAVADADAERAVANGRLDAACLRFADDLLRDVDKDTSSPRFRTFFPMAPSRFTRQALGAQVTRVRAWLGVKDPVLEQHRAELELWSTAADQALVRTHGGALVRGETRILREELAENLTRERDGLGDALGAKARELGLPRDWPNLFFRTQSRPAVDEAESLPPEPSAATPVV
jgi:hypothetical protein